MCRVLGWAGEITSPAQHKKIELILKALILAEEKGNPHGTGICLYSKGGGHQLVKKGIRGSAFLLQGYADVLGKSRDMRAVIGHVRLKTSGEQSDKNAHPFGFRINGDWHFGMHNGVIGCADELANKFGLKKAHPVDSATFFFCLAKEAERRGLVEAIEKVTYEASLTGDFAFALMRKGEIYLWRNDARPLCIFDLREEGLGRFFCSTKEMFKKALELSGVSIKGKVDYFEAKPYRLYKVGHRTSPELEVEPIKDLKHREKPKYSWHSGMSWLDAYDASWQSRCGVRSCQPSTIHTPSLFEEKKKEEKKKEEKNWGHFISALSDEQLELEILETEAAVYGDQPRKELRPYLNALYEEYEEREEKRKKKKKKGGAK